MEQSVGFFLPLNKSCTYAYTRNIPFNKSFKNEGEKNFEKNVKKLLTEKY